MLARLRKLNFVASGSWIAPAGVTVLIIRGCGGGGGGGKGAGANNTTTLLPAGGGGGGGSREQTYCLAVVPGTTYTITIGVGGAGATVAGNSGVNGGPSYVVAGGVRLCEFAGGQGGKGGVTVQAQGGQPFWQDHTKDNLYIYMPAKGGASGIRINTDINGGNPGSYGFRQASSLTTANTQPVNGTDRAQGGFPGAYHGGGGGGCGGYGPDGMGGNGGAGGNATNPGTGVAGSAGSAGSGPGSGGGGGGGGGCGSTGGGSGGNGAAGTDGRITLMWAE